MKQENLYVYAFLETPVLALELPIGICDRIHLISQGGISAVIEPGISVESFENDDKRLVQAVLSHDRVIVKLFEQTTVLPLRFGTAFASEESLLSYLELHTQDYLKTLNQLKGKSEHCLKFIPQIPDETTVPTEGGGRQYFLAKKQRYQTQQNFVNSQAAEWDQIVKIITEIYPSAIISQPQGEDARIYLLVEQQNEPLLAEQFLSWVTACPHWELQLGEALPPYHFIAT